MRPCNAPSAARLRRSELGQFEGGSDDDNEDVIGFRIAPPDTNGDVGPNHYVQYINLIVTIYDKEGTVLLGPLPGNAFWAGLGDTCETSNDGDPIVLYDQGADRWFVSQFAFPSFPSPPYIQCVAVSATGDPLGEYYQYQFELPDTYLNDYPKFGIWPDGYYMTFNGFDVFGGGFQGGAFAFDRAAMLEGDPAAMIEFNTGQEGGVLPSDMDGLIPPPVGAPNYFLTFNLPPSRLIMWEFHADFAAPENSTFTQLSDLLVDEFVTPVCGSFRDQCVPQLDSPELLETLSHATMNRLAYRNFGTHQSLVTNHTVAVEGESGPFAGIRWYELQIPAEEEGGGGNPWSVHQQQTYAPDENWRWMGSIAQDFNGNIALGYSISSAEMHPSIAIAGRLATDPLNALGLESMFLEGTGSQDGTFSRLGRLQLHERRPGRRLHVLVHAGVLRRAMRVRLENAYRVLQVPELLASGPRARSKAPFPTARTRSRAPRSRRARRPRRPTRPATTRCSFRSKGPRTT